VVACISPWNFPLAIFIGQVSAALAAGNVVLAKPAEQTPLIAFRAVQLLHEAGVPRSALQLVPGCGETVGAQLVADPRLQAVLFTGSLAVAQSINRRLAMRSVQECHELPLIAETGGQNAMIVDSSALPEQVVQDAIHSAFDSAGQCCSALRVLYLQQDIADTILDMLAGALHELRIGNPARLSTDVGPVIDRDAQRRLQAHVDAIKANSRPFHQLPLPIECEHGVFFAPTIIEIDSAAHLTEEVFGPVLHVVRYAREQLPQVLDAINASGYGLTLGIHSRIDANINAITDRARVGNIYVNRNQVGAVVGVQPFGGERKSGTGPKAGGPFYLSRLQHFPITQQESSIARQHTVPMSKLGPLFKELSAWLAVHISSLGSIGAAYRNGTMIETILRLPGPTGERNELRFAPRGLVLCVGTSLAILCNQLLAVFATGNVPVMLMTSIDIFPPEFPVAISESIRWIDDTVSTELDFALIDTRLIEQYRPELAQREGSIVGVVETVEDIRIPLRRLMVERCVSTNTTATGGNAALISMQD
jgi:RHH-type proline utilization regulon transcriptional repressor/proline dehydrogenase/delta 1-pyrroline-5-carboxylate dehydrogenase